MEDYIALAVTDVSACGDLELSACRNSVAACIDFLDFLHNRKIHGLCPVPVITDDPLEGLIAADSLGFNSGFFTGVFFHVTLIDGDTDLYGLVYCGELGDFVGLDHDFVELDLLEEVAGCRLFLNEVIAALLDFGGQGNTVRVCSDRADIFRIIGLLKDGLMILRVILIHLELDALDRVVIQFIRLDELDLAGVRLVLNCS